MSEPSTHARLAPSSSARWSVCTASVEYLEENKHLIPPQDWSYADEGSRAHEAAKLILTGTGTPKFDNDAMRQHVEDYVAWVRAEAEPGDRLMVETKVPLPYSPKETGTTDAARFNTRRIFIGDLKYGQGVSVYAEDNTQLAIYAEAIIRVQEELYDIDPQTLVHLRIFQPRDRNDSNPVRGWSLTRKGLAHFYATRIERATREIWSGDVQFKAGPHCDKTFCPGRKIGCKAYGTQGLQALSDDPVDVTTVDTVVETKLSAMPPTASFTREQRQRILKAKPMLETFLKEIEAAEVAALMNGAAPQEFKLVEGKSNRAWSDEEAAARVLLKHLKHDQIYPPVPAELVSPAQAEGLLGKAKAKELGAELSSVITKPKGKPTLVPVSDKRPPLLLTGTEGLKALPDEEALV